MAFSISSSQRPNSSTRCSAHQQKVGRCSKRNRHLRSQTEQLLTLLALVLLLLLPASAVGSRQLHIPSNSSNSRTLQQFGSTPWWSQAGSSNNPAAAAQAALQRSNQRNQVRISDLGIYGSSNARGGTSSSSSIWRGLHRRLSEHSSSSSTASNGRRSLQQWWSQGSSGNPTAAAQAALQRSNQRSQVRISDLGIYGSSNNRGGSSGRSSGGWRGLRRRLAESTHKHSSSGRSLQQFGSTPWYNQGGGGNPAAAAQAALQRSNQRSQVRISDLGIGSRGGSSGRSSGGYRGLRSTATESSELSSAAAAAANRLLLASAPTGNAASQQQVIDGSSSSSGSALCSATINYGASVGDLSKTATSEVPIFVASFDVMVAAGTEGQQQQVRCIVPNALTMRCLYCIAFTASHHQGS